MVLGTVAREDRQPADGGVFNGTGASRQLTHGAITVAFNEDSSTTITFANKTAVALPPAVFVGGRLRQLNSTGFECWLANGGAPTAGSDDYGTYSAVGLNCYITDGAAGRVATPPPPPPTLVDYSVKVYAVPGHPADTMVLFDVSFPGGAEGLKMREVEVNSRSPPQFAPFPQFNLSEAASPALGNTALAMCYGSERPHLLAFNGVSGFPGQCNTLSGGMAVTAWRSTTSPSGVAGAVWTAANQFHLNFHQVVAAGSRSSKTWVHGVSGEISSVPAGTLRACVRACVRACICVRV